jgi:Ni/Fe-hydrogenase subunit HybB-like protein
MTRRLPGLRVGIWPVIGTIFIILGLVAGVRRFALGLGASTNLTDQTPWGLWVGFDLLCGVGLAAGGFTVSALAYIFRKPEFKAVARPAILTAFIGYLLVVGGLIFDLGHPWRIWHPLVMWNHHSVMFEISWCVMLYTTVLFLEVLAMVSERLSWKRATSALHHLTFPLTLASVLLSMLHQSSLGSLFLLVPGRLHELWYSPLLPLFFFSSAVGVGAAMSIVESDLSARSFGRSLPARSVEALAKVAAGVLSFYVVLRLGDLAVRGAWVHILDFDRASWFFLFEIVIGFILPIGLLVNPRCRRNRQWLQLAARLAVMGFVVNRLDIAVTGFEVVSGYTYVPSWEELSVTLMLVSIGVFAFHFAGKHLPVFTEEVEMEEMARRAWVQRSGESLRGLTESVPELELTSD